MIYTKPMLDDCTIEFLRLTNRDNGYGVPTAVPCKSVRRLDCPLEKQKAYELNHFEDATFNRWDQMKQKRDDRYKRDRRINVIKNHRDIWPVFQYSHEKVRLNSGLVYLKSPPSLSSDKSAVHALPLSKISQKVKKCCRSQHAIIACASANANANATISNNKSFVRNETAKTNLARLSDEDEQNEENHGTSSDRCQLSNSKGPQETVNVSTDEQLLLHSQSHIHPPLKCFYQVQRRSEEERTGYAAIATGPAVRLLPLNADSYFEN